RAADERMLDRRDPFTTPPKLDYKENCVFIYIQMQMCKRSLAEWIANNNYESSRSVSTIKRWFKQLVTAVGYIHKKNLIHRDLKPSNILFADNDRL
ncbi:hypothetical protein PRIPAC_90559, partial [Pristionchus pacificus]